MKNFINKFLIFFLLASLSSENIKADKSDIEFSRPITQIYSFEIGCISQTDTYLSPLKFNGQYFALSGRWSKVLPWEQNQWQMNFATTVGYGYLRNKPGSSQMIDLDFDLRWDATRRFKLPKDILLTVGAGLDIKGGVLYLPNNGNNPASAKADISLGLKGGFYKPFKIKELNVLLSDEVFLPIASVFFSPQFGETYYEIYLGNHKGLAHGGWWGNRFSIDNILAFDLDIGPSALRLGYRIQGNSGQFNHIVTEGITNSFVIGWIPGGIGLKKEKPLKATKIMSVY